MRKIYLPLSVFLVFASLFLFLNPHSRQLVLAPSDGDSDLTLASLFTDRQPEKNAPVYPLPLLNMSGGFGGIPFIALLLAILISKHTLFGEDLFCENRWRAPPAGGPVSCFV